MKRTHLFAGAALSAVTLGSVLAGCAPKPEPVKPALTADDQAAGLKTVTLSVKGMH
jgi:hypothetical protein